MGSSRLTTSTKTVVLNKVTVTGVGGGASACLGEGDTVQPPAPVLQSLTSVRVT